jgi:LPXTG-site transpeptidase (sortase) family protein
MKSIITTLKENRDWILIILGSILIVFAILNLFNNDVDAMIARLNLNEPVDQEGFAPIFVPKPSNQDTPVVDRPISPDDPDRIIIERINLDAPIKVAESANVSIGGKDVLQYLVPEEFAVGWHEGTAPLGVVGNTVLSGHHNAYGKVFEHLIDLKVGDTLKIKSGDKEFEYIIANKMILPEKDQPINVRLDNGRWILPSKDERVTLITCWPEHTNSHRLVLVAVPVAAEEKLAVPPAPTPTLQVVRVTTPVAAILEAMSSTPTPVPGSTIIPDTGPADGFFTISNSGNFSINIRESPSLNSKILGTFLKGDDANAISRTESADWLYITYGNIEGWVDAELVEMLTPVDNLPVFNSDSNSP